MTELIALTARVLSTDHRQYVELIQVLQASPQPSRFALYHRPTVVRRGPADNEDAAGCSPSTCVEMVLAVPRAYHPAAGSRDHFNDK